MNNIASNLKSYCSLLRFEEINEILLEQNLFQNEAEAECEKWSTIRDELTRPYWVVVISLDNMWESWFSGAQREREEWFNNKSTFKCKTNCQFLRHEHRDGKKHGEGNKDEEYTNW